MQRYGEACNFLCRYSLTSYQFRRFWKNVFSKLRTAPRLKNMQSEVAAAAHALPIKTLVETFERLRK